MAIKRYADRFLAALAQVDVDRSGRRDKLRDYAKLYADVFRNDRMCLCGCSPPTTRSPWT